MIEDCIHLGSPVRGNKAPDLVRDYHRCEKGHGVVCKCHCNKCNDYQSDWQQDSSSPIKRNLVYHLLPVAQNGIWQRNLDQLKWRIGQFDGIKIMAIMIDGPGTNLMLDPPEAVEEYVRGFDFQFLRLPNNPHLREVESWIPLWNRLREQVDQESITFYGHAKGVTRPVNAGVSCHPWTSLLYHTLLDYPALVDRILVRNPIAGSLKKVGAGFKSSSLFHYSGTFFWVQTKDFFYKRDYRHIDQMWWGTEAWPGVAYKVDQAACVFHKGRVPTLDMYNYQYIIRTVYPELEQWKLQNAKYLSRSGSLTGALATN